MKVNLKLKRSLHREDDLCDWVKCKKKAETQITFNYKDIPYLAFCDDCLKRFYDECDRFTDDYYSSKGS